MSAFLRWQNQYPDRLQQVPLNLFWKRTQFGTGQDDGPDLSLASALGMPRRMGSGLSENLNPSLFQRPKKVHDSPSSPREAWHAP